jgi:hypothetical protein
VVQNKSSRVPFGVINFAYHFLPAGNSQNQSTQFGQSKRSRYAPPSSRPQYRVLHKVVCHGGVNHSNHKKDSHFLDVPKLFAGDSKANVLRGKKEIDVEEYMDGHPEICFIIYRSYNCNAYHETMEDNFDRLPIPRIDPNIISQLKAYFFTLKTDGEEAIPVTEHIHIISPDLTVAIAEAKTETGGSLANLDSEPNLIAPYLQFYHSREILAKLISDPNTALPANSREYLSVLFNFLTTSCGREWLAADTLFKNGMVDRSHFSKLFRLDDVVVTMVDAQPTAHLVELCASPPNSSSLELSVMSWTFDEVFRKQMSVLTVGWPLGVDRVPITALETYPLRYDTSRLAERLRKRGEQFWKCRKRAFVGYDSPNPRFEVQTVSTSSSVQSRVQNT